MNKSTGLTLLTTALLLVYYGCVVIRDRVVFDPGAVIGGIDKAAGPREPKTTKVSLAVQNDLCSATFDTDPATGKLEKGSLKATPAPGSPPGTKCDPTEINPPLSLNGIKVLETGAGHLSIEGSCRYCWFNSIGGMTCIPC